MKKNLLFVLVGIFFGVVLYKSEAASWFRINEMFHFEAFHMYGIIGSAVVLGILVVQLVKRSGAKDLEGKPIAFTPKDPSFPRTLIGGTVFGLGWGLIGACPGPLYILLGAGYWTIAVAIIGALIGALTYGAFRSRLPH